MLTYYFLSGWICRVHFEELLQLKVLNLGKTDKNTGISLEKRTKCLRFILEKTDKDMIKRKIDRYLADFVSFSENTICKRTR